MKCISYDMVIADLDAHPEKRIFWRSGWAFRGASEYEVRRSDEGFPRIEAVCIDNRMCRRELKSWKDVLKVKFDWACVVTCDRNDDREIHLNGLSCLDME